MRQPTSPSKALSFTRWLAQGLLALFYVGTGVFKLVMPLATLAGMWPWVGEHPALLRLTGMLDVAGGLGLVLPALTRRYPGLARLAALGLAGLQACAIAFHVARGEAAATPFNAGLLALALVVWCGQRAAVAPRA